MFEGAVYDYRHGPQPLSQGAWYLRNTQGTQWFIEADGAELPATVHYLGHEYGAGRKTAAMRFALTAGDYRLELTEQPEVIEQNGARYFVRNFQRADALTAVKAGFRSADGERHLAEGALQIPLAGTTAIAAHEKSKRTHVKVDEQRGTGRVGDCRQRLPRLPCTESQGHRTRLGPDRRKIQG